MNSYNLLSYIWCQGSKYKIRNNFYRPIELVVVPDLGYELIFVLKDLEFANNTIKNILDEL